MDRDELEAWLEDKPKSWAVAIAARAALRAVPFAVSRENADSDRSRALLLATLRATISPWAYAGFPAHGEAVVGAARACARDHDAYAYYDAATAAAAAADAATDVTAAAAITFAATAAASIAADAAAYAAADAAAYWSEVEFDTEFLSSGSDFTDEAAASLALSKLWKQQAGSVAKRWNEVKAELLRTFAKEEARGMGQHLDAAERRRLKDLEAEDWGVWTEWYDRRLRGDPPNEALEIERVTSPAIPWDEGPRAANRALREIEEKHARKPPGAELVKPQALRLATMPALAETTAEGLARQIEDWISACLRESEANALPDELLALEALPVILRRMSKALHAEGGTEALEATIAAMAVEIARLKADLALAKNAPRESVFWTSFRKKAGESLGDWKMWGALASGGYLLLGPQISGGALSDLFAMIRPSAP